MKRILTIIVLAAIVFTAASAFFEADKNAKALADFLNTNTLFEYEDGTLTVLNEKFSLR